MSPFLEKWSESGRFWPTNMGFPSTKHRGFHQKLESDRSLLGCAADFGAAGAKRLVSAQFGFCVVVRFEVFNQDLLVSCWSSQFWPHKALMKLDHFLLSVFKTRWGDFKTFWTCCWYPYTCFFFRFSISQSHISSVTKNRRFPNGMMLSVDSGNHPHSRPQVSAIGEWII